MISEKTIRIVQRNGGRILALIGLIFLASLFSSTGLRWNEDITDVLPAGDRMVSDYKEFSSLFNVMDYCYFDIGPRRGAEPIPSSDLADSTDDFVRSLRESGMFSRIMYRWTPQDFQKSIERIVEYRASLFSARDAQRLEAKLRPERIEESLATWRRMLVQSPDPFLARRFYADPLGINDIFIGKLEGLQSANRSLSISAGRLSNRAGDHLMIIALPREPSGDHAWAADFVDEVECLIRRHESESRLPLHIAHFGGHLASVENSEQIKSDVSRTIMFAAGMIILLGYLFFGRLSLLALVFIPTLFGGAFAGGLARWIRPDICAISIGCGSMLIGISVDYGLHVLYSADRMSPVPGRKKMAARLLGRLTAPIVLSALTTVAAFAVLCLSEIPGYQDLGLFASLGILGAMIAALFVLPTLVARLLEGRSEAARVPKLDLSRAFEKMLSAPSRTRKWLLVLLAAFSLLALPGIRKVGFQGDIRKLNSLSPGTLADQNLIIGNMGELMAGTAFMVSGDDLDQALQRNEELAEIFSRYEEKGQLSSVISVSSLLPSRDARRENRRRWIDFWSGARESRLVHDFTAACRKEGLRVEAFDDSALSFPGDSPEFSYEDYRRGILDDLLGNYISTRDGRAAVLTTAALSSPESFESLVAKTNAELPGFVGFRGADFVRHIVELIYRELLFLGPLCLLAISLLLLLLLRNLRMAVSVLLPLLLSLAWSLGIMGWFGLRINIMNSMVLIFILGLIVDYGIFLAGVWRDTDRGGSGGRKQFGYTCNAVTMSALTTLCGVGVLAFAGHPALHSIGFTALIGISCGWFAVFGVGPLMGVRSGGRKKNGF